MNRGNTINVDDFVDVILKAVRFSSKSRYRLVGGFELLPQDYCNRGPVPELSHKKRTMYIREAKIALTYFTTQGIIKEWYKDIENGVHINTMSWDTTLSVICQITSRHYIEREVCVSYY